jgi:integrase
MPLRALYRDADQITGGAVPDNPTVGLRLPAVRGTRDRIASPDEALRLLAALPPQDRALWGTALYAGLRRGELQALLWQDVDLAGATIAVTASWDREAGRVGPKSQAGARRIPLIARLHDLLAEHRVMTGRADGLVFGRTAERPFEPSSINTRARRRWQKEKLAPIGLHECRHTFANYMIDAGCNAKLLSSYLGHASISITIDRYGI